MAKDEFVEIPGTIYLRKPVNGSFELRFKHVHLAPSGLYARTEEDGGRWLFPYSNVLAFKHDAS